MRNIKLVLAYDGTDFHGWQTQPNGRTVQETLEKAIAEITGGKVHAHASGRTDAGVHALGQVANFRTESHLSAQILLRAINANLPADMQILEAEEVPLAFHANKDAIGKR